MTTLTSTIATEEKPQEIKSTLFLRLIAFVIDFTFLGITGFLLGLVFRPLFVLANVHGVLIGWFIATLYFSLGNSQLFSGQTLGKKALSLKVVDSNGHELSIKTAILRSLLFTTPFFLLEYLQNLSFISSVINQIFAGLTILYYVGLTYFFIVNTKSRQTLHDIFTRTLVIHTKQNPSIIPLKITSNKVYGYVGLIVLIFLSFLALYFNFNNKVSSFIEVFEANQETLVSIAEEVSDKEEILYVESSKIHISDDSGVGIVVEAWTRTKNNEDETDKLLSQILDIIAEKEFNINKLDYAEITLKYGYDIGIADFKTSTSKTFKSKK